jgi:hypothetical protein
MKTRKVQLNLYVQEQYRDLLQRIAAERMLKDPKRSVTASKIGAEIIGEYLEKLESSKERRTKE